MDQNRTGVEDPMSSARADSVVTVAAELAGPRLSEVSTARTV